MNQHLKTAEDKFKKALEHFEADLGGVRSGRASAGLVDSVKVEVYGQTMPLRGLATISTPDVRTIQIQPWDQGNINAIDKAIREQSELGLNPSSDGHVIRVTVPALSEETRAQQTKLIAGKAETCNISLRNARHEVLAAAKAEQKNKQLTEDDAKKLEKDLNALIDRYQGMVQERVSKKQQELMEIQ